MHVVITGVSRGIGHALAERYRAAGHEAVDGHRVLPPDPVRPVGGLILDGGIPPSVVVEYVVGRGEVHPDPACLQRENEDGNAVVLLEAVDHLIPLSLRCAAVQEERFDVELVSDHRDEQVSHASVL